MPFSTLRRLAKKQLAARWPVVKGMLLACHSFCFPNTHTTPVRVNMLLDSSSQYTNAPNTILYEHAALQSFTLDFQGRVTLASVKNFQLVHDDDGVYGRLSLCVCLHVRGLDCTTSCGEHGTGRSCCTSVVCWPAAQYAACACYPYAAHT